MTRVTDFGRKRKYLEAGFASEPTSTSNEKPVSGSKTADQDQGDSALPKKKRKDTKEQKTGGIEQVPDGISPGGAVDVGGKEKDASIRQKKAKMTKKRGGAKSVHHVIPLRNAHCPWLGIAISGYKKRTEQRRLGRISDRLAETVCFACREKGHAAKDCPTAVGGDGDSQKNANTIVGICYRFVSSFPELSLTQRYADVVQQNTRCLVARSRKIL